MGELDPDRDRCTCDEHRNARDETAHSGTAICSTKGSGETEPERHVQQNVRNPVGAGQKAQVQVADLEELAPRGVQRLGVEIQRHQAAVDDEQQEPQPRDQEKPTRHGVNQRIVGRQSDHRTRQGPLRP